MNAERLHAIASAVRADLDNTKVPSLLSEMTSALQVRVQQPGSTQGQQVGDLRTRLNQALEQSITNDFSDAWRQALDEMDAWEILGNQLRERLEEIFLRNEITPETAASELSELNQRVAALKANLDQLTPALDGLKIGAEELEQGEFEVGILIPRAAVSESLSGLGKEIVELNSILLPLMELDGGKRPVIKVRSIASSGFQINVDSWAGLALTVSLVIESLLRSYEKVRSFRAQKNQLESEGMPEEVTRPIGEYASNLMKVDIDALAKQLVKDARTPPETGRANELTIEIRHSLTKLARRIDEGYSIHVRSFTPPGEGEEQDPDETAAQMITERQPRMRTMNLTGKPILELPDPQKARARKESPTETITGGGASRPRRTRKET